jgi:hypothetical protein
MRVINKCTPPASIGLGNAFSHFFLHSQPISLPQVCWIIVITDGRQGQIASESVFLHPFSVLQKRVFRAGALLTMQNFCFLPAGRSPATLLQRTFAQNQRKKERTAGNGIRGVGISRMLGARKCLGNVSWRGESEVSREGKSQP